MRKVPLQIPFAGFQTTLGLVVVTALLLPVPPPPVAAQNHGPAKTFAESFNPSGDPIGGGPNYSKLVKVGETLIRLDRNATVQDLLKLAKSYFEEESQRLVEPGTAAPDGSTIFVESGAKLVLDGYHQITFNDRVILASDRGAKLGPIAYTPGALIQRHSMWPNREDGGNAQLKPAFLAWNDGRFTGFRVQGPFDFRGPNGGKTRGWLGGATFFAKYGIDGPFELDNNEIYGWPDFAAWWYHVTSGDSMHHNWVHHNRQVGWGYGLYPGRPRNKDEEAVLRTDYNLFQENKHSLDHNSARPDSWQRLVFLVRGNAFLGEHGQDVIHAHVNQVDGCSYAAWKTEYIDNLIIHPGEPPSVRDLGLGLPPKGGYLKIENLYLDRSHRRNMTVSQSITVDRVDQQDPAYRPDWASGCNAPHGDVHVDVHTNLEGAVIPLEGSVPNATTFSEGEPLIIDLSKSHDPDGHAIGFHEILWGDGKSVTDPGHREVVYTKSARHVYEQSGTYLVRVTAFNAFGLPSRMTFHEITVKPLESKPRFVAFVGTNLPPVEGRKWPGYFSARLSINGHVVMDWQDYASFSGYERIEWDATPIDGDNFFQLKMEVRTDRNISDPDGREPGLRGAEFQVDRFYLFGRTGKLYEENLFLSTNEVEPYIRTWGGGGSSSLFNRHDRAIGPSYGRSFALDPIAVTEGAIAEFTTRSLALDPRTAKNSLQAITQ